MCKKKLRRDAVVCFSAHARELEYREARRDGKSCAALLWHATCEAKRMAKRRSSSFNKVSVPLGTFLPMWLA